VDIPMAAEQRGNGAIVESLPVLFLHIVLFAVAVEFHDRASIRFSNK
jgi:hypothetical protein